MQLNSKENLMWLDFFESKTKLKHQHNKTKHVSKVPKRTRLEMKHPRKKLR
jgi:hypothetical protein